MKRAAQPATARRTRFVDRLWIVLLFASLLATSGCDQLDTFIRLNMHPEYNVDWSEEGRIFVLKNGCYDLATDENFQTNEAYLDCTLALALDAEGNPVFEPPYPVTPGVDDVEIVEIGRDDWEEAIPYVERYRWITVNPSYTAIGGALVVAAVQLKIMHQKGLVLVYLPQGPDRTRVDYSSWDSREDEAARYICGGFRIDHHAFKTTLRNLVDTVTATGYDPQQVPFYPGFPLVVTAYSYSGPPTLEVVKDNEKVFFVDVAPNFGWAQWRGEQSWDRVGGSCNPFAATDSVHEMKFPNPAVGAYYRNQAFARVPQCLVYSPYDCISLAFKGTAIAGHYDHKPDGEGPGAGDLYFPCNDPTYIWPVQGSGGIVENINIVGGHRTETFVRSEIEGPSEYCAAADAWTEWGAGWTREASGGEHAFQKRYTGPVDYAADVCSENLWSWPGSERESCDANYSRNHDPDDSSVIPTMDAGCLLKAFQANGQTRNSLRHVLPLVPDAASDLSYDRQISGYQYQLTPGVRSYYGHTGYWMTGTPLPLPEDLPVPLDWYTANINFRDVMRDCAEAFSGSPSCESCDAGADWAEGHSPPLIQLRYREVPDDWPEAVWFGGDVENEDVIYVPYSDVLDQAALFAAYESLLQRFGRSSGTIGTPSQLHLSTKADVVDLEVRVSPPDDDATAQVTSVHIGSTRPDPEEVSYETEVFNSVHHGGPTMRTYFPVVGWDGGVARMPDYDELPGVWMDVYADTNFVDDDGTSYPSPNQPFGRVLWLRGWDGKSRTLPLTVPDVRDFRSKLARRPVDAVSMVQRFTWKGVYKAGEYVSYPTLNGISSATVRDMTAGLELDTVAAGPNRAGCGGSTPHCDSMRHIRYETIWQVKRSWCAAYPADPVCGARLKTFPGPSRSTFRIRVEVCNKAPDPGCFFREFDVTVRRPAGRRIVPLGISEVGPGPRLPAG
jgi:hypothetical protein